MSAYFACIVSDSGEGKEINLYFKKCKMNYVNMQEKCVNIQGNYVYVQDDCVDM